MNPSWAENYLTAGIESIRANLRARRKAAGEREGAGLVGDPSLAELHQRGKALGEDAVPLLRLSTRLGLTDTEQLVVWLLLAHELDHACRELIREWNSEHSADVAVDTVRRLVHGGRGYRLAYRDLEPHAPLSRWRIIDRTDGKSSGSAYRQTLGINPRVVALACGEVAIDAALDGMARTRDGMTPWESIVIDDALKTRATTGLERGTVLAVGARSSGRRTLLASLASLRGWRVLEINCSAVATDSDAALSQVRAIRRECRLLDLTPLLVGIEELATDEHRLQLLERVFVDGFLATASRPLPLRWSTAPTVVEIPPPSGTDRARVWRTSIPELPDDDCTALANRFPIVPGIAVRAASIARRTAEGRALSAGDVHAAIDTVCEERLGGLATRVTVTQTWDDLVLPSEQREALREVLARLNHRTRVYEEWGLGAKVGRGLGMVGLLSGPPGTGKTMTAGLIAGSLGVPLYRVETSGLVSKYIGETQKNLARLFEAVEGSHVVLLFDEADSMFGKRTDVRSSNDRHANLETNFLLQRLESFTGACFLTTNHEAALDDAFKRRISVHIRFPAPEANERRQIWERLLANGTPIAGALRLDALAERFALSGGHIRNAVVRAAFLAADRNRGLDHALLAHAANLECEAIGKVVETPSSL